jgi:hypothetical protein
MDLTMEGPFDDMFAGLIDHDKWAILEERLRTVEGNNLTDLVLVAKVRLVSNILVPNKFRVSDFIKYTRLARTRISSHTTKKWLKWSK